jgi:Ca2+-binding EF-hand superfamily protein
VPQGLSDEFLRRDRDGDGQLTVAEYAPESKKENLDAFRRFDANRDGLVTAAEYLRATKPAGKASADRDAKPRRARRGANAGEAGAKDVDTAEADASTAAASE